MKRLKKDTRKTPLFKKKSIQLTRGKNLPDQKKYVFNQFRATLTKSTHIAFPFSTANLIHDNIKSCIQKQHIMADINFGMKYLCFQQYCKLVDELKLCLQVEYNYGFANASSRLLYIPLP